MTNVIGDRIEPGFFEADDEGYIQTPEEPGPGGKAQGIEFVLYIQTPDKTLEHYGCAAGFEFTEDELASWPMWMADQYHGIDFSGDGEDLEASIYDDYREDEDNDALMMRLTVNNHVYNKLRNEWTIFYHGLEKYIAHCKAKREETANADMDKLHHEASRERLREYMNPYHAEDGDPLPAIDPPQTNKDMRRLHGTELLEEFQNDWGGSDDIDDLIENKWAVVTQRGDDGEGWVNGANTLDEIARLIMAVHTAEYYVEWVEGIYDLDTGKNADITSSQVLTVSVHDNNGDSTELTSDI